MFVVILLRNATADRNHIQVGPGTIAAGVYSYKFLPLAGATVYENLTDVSSYSYDPSKEELVSYDTPNIVTIKAQYVQNNGLAGSMFWDVSIVLSALRRRTQSNIVIMTALDGPLRLAVPRDHGRERLRIPRSDAEPHQLPQQQVGQHPEQHGRGRTHFHHRAHVDHQLDLYLASDYHYDDDDLPHLDNAPLWHRMRNCLCLEPDRDLRRW